jgi:hypothetical protein
MKRNKKDTTIKIQKMVLLFFGERALFSRACTIHWAPRKVKDYGASTQCARVAGSKHNNQN